MSARFANENAVNTAVRAQDVVARVEAVTLAHGRGEAFNTPRQRIRVPGGVLHMMGAAWPAEGLMGYKAYTSFKDDVRFLVHGMDILTGAPVLVAEGNRLGQLRTGAATAVAVKHLAARRDVVTILGTGFQAWGQVECVASLGALGELRVHSRTADKRDTFAERARTSLGLSARAYDNAEAAVKGADVVIACTTSATPVVMGEWLKPGALVCGVGANSLSRREIDGKTLARSARILVDSVEVARLESGALVMAAETGRFHWESVTELGRGLSARTTPDQIITFFSHGLALWDLAALVALRSRISVDQLPLAYPVTPS